MEVNYQDQPHPPPPLPPPPSADQALLQRVFVQPLPTQPPESPTMDQVLRDEVNFIQNVSQFFNQEALSDIVLKINDQSFFGHKFVLAKSSDVFRTMLYDRQWSQNSNDELELSETPECCTVFEKFLRYLYTAEVNIGVGTAVGILCLADKYNVDSLKRLCIKYMVENSRSPRVRNALNWYPWSKVLHLPELHAQCTRTICWNAHEIITSPEWVGMEADFIADMLGNSELVVQNEYSIAEALSQWLLHESRLEQAAQNAQRLLPLVRFPQMQVWQLHALEQGSLASHPDTGPQLQALLSQAYRYRALCPSQASLNLSFVDPYYLPRDYVDMTADTVRMQNTLRFGIQVDVKMYRGPVPTETRDADWKVTYRKQGDTWSLQLYCHETAMVNNEARIQASVLIYDEQEKVIQVHREGTSVVTRGNCLNVQLSTDQPSLARNMAVLIKPVPS